MWLKHSRHNFMKAIRNKFIKILRHCMLNIVKYYNIKRKELVELVCRVDCTFKYN